MFVIAAENFTNTAQGTHLAFETTPTASTTSAERMRILQSGRVGIGTDCANAAALLDLSGTNPTFEMRDTTGAAKSLLVSVDANKANFYEAAGAAGLFTLDLANARVGVNVAAPTVALDVLGAIRCQLDGTALAVYNAAGTSYFQVYHGLVVDLYASTKQIHVEPEGLVYPNGAAFVKRTTVTGMDIPGAVGIGMATPFAGQLHVNKATAGGLGGDLWITNSGTNTVGSYCRLAFGPDATTDTTPNAAAISA